MSYLESQQIFYQQFPVFATYVVVGIISFVILYNFLYALFKNKVFVKIVCYLLLFIPVFVVALLAHFAGINTKGMARQRSRTVSRV